MGRTPARFFSPFLGGHGEVHDVHGLPGNRPGAGFNSRLAEAKLADVGVDFLIGGHGSAAQFRESHFTEGEVERDQRSGHRPGDYRPDDQPARLAAAVGDLGNSMRAERDATEGFGDEIEIVFALEISTEPRFLVSDPDGRIPEFALGAVQAAQPDNESGVVHGDWTNSHTEAFCFPRMLHNRNARNAVALVILNRRRIGQ